MTENEQVEQPEHEDDDYQQHADDNNGAENNVQEIQSSSLGAGLGIFPWNFISTSSSITHHPFSKSSSWMGFVFFPSPPLSILD